VSATSSRKQKLQRPYGVGNLTRVLIVFRLPGRGVNAAAVRSRSGLSPWLVPFTAAVSYHDLVVLKKLIEAESCAP